MVNRRFTQNNNNRARSYTSSAQSRVARRSARQRALRSSHSMHSRRSQKSGVCLPKPNGGEIVLSRRHFLLGAAGIGAAVALTAGATIIAKQKEEEAQVENVLSVPKESVISINDFSSIENIDGCVSLHATAELPYGSLVWATDSALAACLIPGEMAKPLTQVALLSLSSGTQKVVLPQATGMSQGFEIYDVRASSSGVIWIEANILDGIWRIFTAPLSKADTFADLTDAAVLAEEGTGDYEMPTLAAVNTYAYWQVLPSLTGTQTTESSLVKRVAFGQENPEVVYSSNGRMTTPIYSCEDAVIITPRVTGTSSTYQLTRIDAQTAQETESMVLPSGMKPFEAGYGKTGFMFSFDAIYNFGEGISNLGTYVPYTLPENSNYTSVNWLSYTRTPTAPPAWSSKYLMIKSTSQVLGVNPETNEYFSLPVESGADDYGDYLATTGEHPLFVTFSNIDHKPLEGEAIKHCLVRIWKTLA